MSKTSSRDSRKKFTGAKIRGTRWVKVILLTSMLTVSICSVTATAAQNVLNGADASILKSIDIDEDLNAQITKIVISDRCAKSYPCQHYCTIICANGQSISTSLNGYEVKVLSLSIDHHKFISDSNAQGNPLNHFSDYDVSSWNNITAQEVVERILSRSELT